ncbi:MAG: glycosyltransferase family 4 protein [Thermoanaerobaculia bacterium]
MSDLRAAAGWRVRRILRPLREPYARVQRLPAAVRERVAAARFRQLVAQLERQRAVAGDRPPRILAAGAWSFPSFSHSFVYDEIASWLDAGLDVRLAVTSPSGEPPASPGATRLAGRILPLSGARRVGVACLRRARERDGAAVAALFGRIAQATGRAAAELEQEPHVLRGFTLARLAEAWGADYLHSYFFYEGALATFVAQQLLALPRGLTAYADHCLTDYPWKLVSEQLATADLVVATSDRVRRELLELCPAAAPRLLVKPNTVDTDFFRGDAAPEPGPGDPYRLLSVSRFDPKKGLSDLLAAAVIWRDAGVPFRLEIVGGPSPFDTRAQELARALESTIEESGLRAHVTLAGVLAADGVRSALRRAHLFVAPSIETASGDKDGVPTALLEAMSCGVPVVSTRAGSIDELVEHGRSGVLVEPGRPKELARAVELLLGDPGRRRELGTAGAERVRERFARSVREPELARRIAERIDECRRGSRETGA